MMAVYFIRVGRYFKIGFSDDPVRRFHNLHRGGTRYTFPADASWALEDRELYKVLPDAELNDEHLIHQALWQFGMGLEWYLDEPALREFVDNCEGGVYPVVEVERPEGPGHDEYDAVQHGRALREIARWQAKRGAA